MHHHIKHVTRGSGCIMRVSARRELASQSLFCPPLSRSHFCMVRKMSTNQSPFLYKKGCVISMLELLLLNLLQSNSLVRVYHTGNIGGMFDRSITQPVSKWPPSTLTWCEHALTCLDGRCGTTCAHAQQVSEALTLRDRGKATLLKKKSCRVDDRIPLSSELGPGNRLVFFSFKVPPETPYLNTWWTNFSEKRYNFNLTLIVKHIKKKSSYLECV